MPLMFPLVQNTRVVSGDFPQGYRIGIFLSWNFKAADWSVLLYSYVQASENSDTQIRIRQSKTLYNWNNQLRIRSSSTIQRHRVGMVVSYAHYMASDGGQCPSSRFGRLYTKM